VLFWVCNIWVLVEYLILFVVVVVVVIIVFFFFWSERKFWVFDQSGDGEQWRSNR
jgi:nitrogen fixation-related uncharacterized protein